jgi:LCP family protein required for cell wall assembly
VAPSANKPYRRFRSHGKAADNPQSGLEALRDLNDAPPAPNGRRQERRAEAKPPSTPRPGPSRRRWWSLRGVGPGGIAARVFGLLLLAVAVWAVAGYLTLRGAAQEANAKVRAGARAALSDPRGGLLGTPQNTLVIGSDAAQGRTGARADTLLVMRTDPDSGRIKYLSLPRDTRVELQGQGTVKLGETFAYRGIRGVVGTITSGEIGLPIHHVIVLDFQGVAKMVDAVGGVEVNNPFDLRDCEYPGGRRVSFPRRRITLTGEDALVYVRVRKCDTDLERAQRQQLVVAAVKSKLLSWTSLPTAPWRGARLVRPMATDMSTTDLAKFGWLQGRLESRDDDRFLLAGRPQTIGGISYYIIEPNAAGRQLRRFMRS